MRTLTTLGTALGLALLLHAPAWAQTLGELSAAQGVGSSVSAAEASSATTARNVRDSLTSHLSSSSLSSSGGKSAWADGGDAHGQVGSAGAKGWATARSGQSATGKGWLSAGAGGPAPRAGRRRTAGSRRPTDAERPDRSLGRRHALRRQLLVDHFLELVEGQRAGEHPPVDEEGGRAIDAHPLAVGHVLVDRRLERLVLEALIELGRVEAHVLRVLLQLVLAERGLIGEQSGVILPELALRVGAARGLGGRACLRVHGEREVAVDEPHLGAVVLHHLIDGALGPPAERALVVRELDDGDRRLGAAAALRAAGGGDLDHGRAQRHRRLVRLLELLDEGLAPPLHALLLQVLDDARPDLLERLAPELPLVGVVDLLDLVVGRLGHLGRDLLLLELGRRGFARARLLLHELIRDHLVEPLAQQLVALVLELDQLGAHVLLELGARDGVLADRGDLAVAGGPGRGDDAEGHGQGRDRQRGDYLHAGNPPSEKNRPYEAGRVPSSAGRALLFRRSRATGPHPSCGSVPSCPPPCCCSRWRAAGRRSRASTHARTSTTSTRSRSSGASNGCSSCPTGRCSRWPMARDGACWSAPWTRSRRRPATGCTSRASSCPR